MVGMALGRPIPERAALPQVRSGVTGRSRGLHRGEGCGGSRRWHFRRSKREPRESARWVEEDRGREREPRRAFGETSGYRAPLRASTSKCGVTHGGNNDVDKHGSLQRHEHNVASIVVYTKD